MPTDAEAMVQGSGALKGNVASHLPPGDDALWKERLIIWKESASWHPALTAWLQPRFRADAMKRLKPSVFRDLCWDDTDWLEVLGRCIKEPIETVKEDLADALLNGTIRTYHGCRTEDAGSYFREGLRVHRKDILKARALSIIDAHPELHYMRSQLDKAIAEIHNTIDDGRSYVVVSDSGLLDDAAHYLIHGSEWIMALFSETGRRILRSIGAPTLLEIDLPFAMTNSSDRCGFAEDMLMEWTRLTCNGEEWIAPVRISFMLSQDLPGACIVGHSHPAALRNPHDRERIYRSPVTSCKHCKADKALALQRHGSPRESSLSRSK